MLKRQRFIASILLYICVIMNMATPVAYASELVKFHGKKPPVYLQNTSELAPNSTLPQPDQGSVLGASTSLLTAGSAPLDLGGDSNDSANIRIPPRMVALPKKVYRSDENVVLSVINPDSEPIAATITDTKGTNISVPVTEVNTGTTTTVDIASTDSIRPGRFTVSITDSRGQVTSQNFSWGVLAMNFDKSEYHPGETADISFGVLNDNGDMVCDANLMLQVTNTALGIDTTFQTGVAGNNQIVINPQCQSHDFSLQPDYEAHYHFGQAGVYNFIVSAATDGVSHIVTDSIRVTNAIPFDVQRVSATRIYPPNTYPMLFNITAQRDFSGTVTETVPDSFTITPATQSAVAATGQTGSVSSYDNMQTVYLNNNDPAADLQQAIIASDSGGLVMPFIGDYPITQGFGAQLTDPALQSFYTSFGLAGHDGIDFGVPMFTPLYAVDDGTVIWSGPGDYGVTIIIKHGWGESYYGHLSSTVAKVGQSVTKGELIGYSGESGDATGPHLHFGMRPNNPDMTNGYYGKIDPLPYLPFGHELEPVAAIPQTESQIGQQLIATVGTGILGTSVSASVTPGTTLTPTTSIQPTVLPTIALPISTPASSPEATIVPTVELPLQVTPTPQPNVAQTIASATPSADESFSVLSKQIKVNEALAASTQTEKVKVITWQVSLKKGEKITLGYDYQAPEVSPEFYLLGPMQFYAGNSNKVVYQEQRQWEVASDDVGTEWFNNNNGNTTWNGYSWQNRQKITINSSEVSSASASPTIDYQGGHAQASSVTTLNWKHTVGNYNNRLLIVSFNSCQTQADWVTSVTYGAQSMVRYYSYNAPSGDYELWYLVNPAVGTNTITGNFANADCVDGGSTDFYNVNTGNPLGSVTQASNTSAVTSISNTITTVPGQVLFDTLSLVHGNVKDGGSDTITQGAGQNPFWQGITYLIGSFKLATSTSTTMSWTFTSDTYAYLAVPINPAPAPTVTFMDSGGDATEDTNSELDFWSSNANTAEISVDNTKSETGTSSLEFQSSGTGASGNVNENNAVSDAGTRISEYVNFSTLPTSTCDFITEGLAGTREFTVALTSTGLLEVTTGGGLVVIAASTTTVSLNTWYRIALSYQVESTTDYAFKLYDNGTQIISYSQTSGGTTLTTAGGTEFSTGWDTTSVGNNLIMHIDDIYVDTGVSDLSDPGNIHVAAKRPFSNGALNQFTGAGTQSGYGSGNAPYVNVVPFNTIGDVASPATDGNSEEYTLESASTGSVNIAGYYYIADDAWVYGKVAVACSISSIPNMINGGVYTPVTLTTSAAMYTSLVTTSIYPSTNQGVGITSCSTGSTGEAVTLYDTGMQIAYTALQPANNYLSNFPVLVNSPDANFVNKTQANGNDVVFTDSTGENLLPYEIEGFNNGWNMQPAYYSGSFSVNAQSTVPCCVKLSTDGTKMFIIDHSSHTIYEYTLSTPFNLQTATYSGNSYLEAQDTAPTALVFSPDGTKMYLSGFTNETIYEYTLATPWLITSGNITYAGAGNSFKPSTQDTEPNGWAFSSDGTKMYMIGEQHNDVYEYTLSTAWDPASETYFNDISVSAQGTIPGDLSFSTDFTKMYVLEYNDGSHNGFIQQYALSTPGNVTTATYANEYLNSGAQDTTSEAIAFDNADGSNIYMVGQQHNSVYQYNLSGISAWVNVSTLSATQNTNLYMYYDNPSASSITNAHGVWNSNYKGVWHLSPNGAAPSMTDSTSNNNTATNHGTTNSLGQIDGAANFNGTSQYIDLGAGASLNPGVTNIWSVNLWFKASTLAQDNTLIEDGVGPTNGYQIAWDQSPCATTSPYNFNITKFGVINTCMGAVPTDGNIHMLSVVWGTGGTVLYLDGQYATTSADITNMKSSTTDGYLGALQGGSNWFSGNEDEVEILNNALNPGWIGTEYNDQATPSAFYTLNPTVETDIYAPTLTQLLRHGEFYGTVGNESGIKQPFTW